MKPTGALTRPKSVLIVDDYPDAADTLASLLNYEGFTTRVAMSGKEALAAAATEPPAVVVLEPRTTGAGWELARRLANPGGGSSPLVVALTTDSSPASRQAAGDVGIRLYLVKPEDPGVLVRALRQHGRAALDRLRVPASITRRMA